MNTAQPEKGSSLPPIVKVTDLQSLIDLHQQPIEVNITAYGKLLQFTGRRLVPAEVAEVRNLIKLAVPPRNDKGDYDFDAEDFKRDAQKYREQARAKTLFLGYEPMFKNLAASKGADLSSMEKLTAFVQSLPIADDALELLSAAVMNEPVSLVDLTGFSSDSNSPKS